MFFCLWVGHKCLCYSTPRSAKPWLGASQRLNFRQPQSTMETVFFGNLVSLCISFKNGVHSFHFIIYHWHVEFWLWSRVKISRSDCMWFVSPTEQHKVCKFWNSSGTRTSRSSGGVQYLASILWDTTGTIAGVHETPAFLATVEAWNYWLLPEV